MTGILILLAIFVGIPFVEHYVLKFLRRSEAFLDEMAERNDCQ